MDTHSAAPNTSNSNIEMKRNNVSIVFPNRAQFYSSCELQNFSMPDSIIFYISKNPSALKSYQKMIQSCKYFFTKNPIIIVPTLFFTELKERKGWCAQGSLPSKDPPNGGSIYLNKITSKVWITDSMNVFEHTPNLQVVTSFMPKIYQCDAASISIFEQMFSFNDLMVISSKCEELHLSDVVIMNNDEVVLEREEDQFYFETAVSLEALFKALPNVKKFRYDLPENSVNIITFKTAEELLKIPHFLCLDSFEIGEIPEIFDIESFYGHIKQNKRTEIRLIFSELFSDEYITQVYTIVDEIRGTENPVYKVPKIGLPGGAFMIGP